MIVDAELHRIRTGEAKACEARAVLRELIAREGGGAAPAVYGALRGWTWKALQLRRFDDELEDWHRLIKATASALKRRAPNASFHVEALAHLVDDSIRYASSHTRTQLLTRSHMGEILAIVQRNNGRIDRERLEALAGLGRSRLSQLLTELRLAGLLDEHRDIEDGRKKTFVLTDGGREFLDLWRNAQHAKARHASDPNAAPRSKGAMLKVVFSDENAPKKMELQIWPLRSSQISTVNGSSGSAPSACEAEKQDRGEASHDGTRLFNLLRSEWHAHRNADAGQGIVVHPLAPAEEKDEESDRYSPKFVQSAKVLEPEHA